MRRGCDFSSLGSTISRTPSLLLASIFAVSAVSGAQAPSTFNHLSTGFALEGAHARLQCEACHKSGTPARGVPRSWSVRPTAAAGPKAIIDTVAVENHLLTLANAERQQFGLVLFGNRSAEKDRDIIGVELLQTVYRETGFDPNKL